MRRNHPESLFLTWINFKPTMVFTYLTFPKLQRLHRLSLRMDELCHLTLCNRCNYLSMLLLKLNHVSNQFFGICEVCMYHSSSWVMRLNNILFSVASLALGQKCGYHRASEVILKYGWRNATKRKPIEYNIRCIVCEMATGLLAIIRFRQIFYNFCITYL